MTGDPRIATNDKTILSALQELVRDNKVVKEKDVKSALVLAMDIKNKKKVEKAPNYSTYGDMCEPEADWKEYYDPVYDDVDGSELDPALVEEGEKKEMERYPWSRQ